MISSGPRRFVGISRLVLGHPDLAQSWFFASLPSIIGCLPFYPLATLGKHQVG